MDPADAIGFAVPASAAGQVCANVVVNGSPVVDNQCVALP